MSHTPTAAAAVAAARRATNLGFGLDDGAGVRVSQQVDVCGPPRARGAGALQRV
jgi:hypothetical protein